MANSSASAACPAPFLASSVGVGGGYMPGRFCGKIAGTTECCLPCPATDWIYSDDFNKQLTIAYWFNVPALVLQVWLLLTFLVLPEETSHRHYLSVGFVLSLMLFQLAFIVPLGAQPDQCYDAITPKDMYSSMSCAWSGALVVAGSMGAIVWVLLRSLWTHLRVVWDVHETKLIFYLFQIIGWGLPALFLALTIGITGVSYRIGTTCLPNQQNALVTWIGWLIAFACAAALIQFATTGFCLMLYVRQMMRGDASSEGSRGSNFTSFAVASQSSVQPKPLAKLDRRMAWRRVRRVLKLQYRSIALTILGIIETVYFGGVFLSENNKTLAGVTQSDQAKVLEWLVCYLSHGEDKSQCPPLAKTIGLNEGVIVGAFLILSIVGILTFGLMARRSMFIGWYHLLTSRDRGTGDGADDEDFIIISPISPKRKSFGRPLESEKNLHEPMPVPILKKTPDSSAPVSPVTPTGPTGVLPEPVEGRNASIPEAGDVTRRHETTNLFEKGEGEDGDGDELEEELKGRKKRYRVSRVNEDDLA